MCCFDPIKPSSRSDTTTIIMILHETRALSRYARNGPPFRTPCTARYDRNIFFIFFHFLLLFSLRAFGRSKTLSGVSGPAPLANALNNKHFVFGRMLHANLSYPCSRIHSIEVLLNVNSDARNPFLIADSQTHTATRGHLCSRLLICCGKHTQNQKYKQKKTLSASDAANSKRAHCTSRLGLHKQTMSIELVL